MVLPNVNVSVPLIVEPLNDPWKLALGAPPEALNDRLEVVPETSIISLTEPLVLMQLLPPVTVEFQPPDMSAVPVTEPSGFTVSGKVIEPLTKSTLKVQLLRVFAKAPVPLNVPL